MPLSSPSAGGSFTPVGGLAPTVAPTATTTTFALSQTLYAGLYNANVSVTITKADILLPYIQSGSVFAVGLYDYNTNALLTSGTATTTGTAGYLTVSLSNYAITAGKKCWWAVLNQTAESTSQLAASAGSNNVFYTFNLTGQTALPSTLPTANRNSTSQNPYIQFY